MHGQGIIIALVAGTVWWGSVIYVTGRWGLIAGAAVGFVLFAGPLWALTRR
jgi:hypothetical protein